MPLRPLASEGCGVCMLSETRGSRQLAVMPATVKGSRLHLHAAPTCGTHEVRGATVAATYPDVPLAEAVDTWIRLNRFLARKFCPKFSRVGVGTSCFTNHASRFHSHRDLRCAPAPSHPLFAASAHTTRTNTIILSTAISIAALTTASAHRRFTAATAGTIHNSNNLARPPHHRRIAPTNLSARRRSKSLWHGGFDGRLPLSSCQWKALPLRQMQGDPSELPTIQRYYRLGRAPCTITNPRRGNLPASRRKPTRVSIKHHSQRQFCDDRQQAR